MSKKVSKATASLHQTTTNTQVHTFKHSCDSQEFLLVWLDEKISHNNAECQSLTEQINSIVHTIDVFNDIDHCFQFVKNSNKQNVFLIVSGRLAEKAVVRLHPLDILTGIFIFCLDTSQHQSWTKQFDKVRGVFNDTKKLGESFKEIVRQLDKNAIGMSFVTFDDISDENIQRLDQAFMYTSLIKDILLSLEYNQKSRQDLIEYCKVKYKDLGGQLNEVQNFQTNYTPETSVEWYTRETFVYHLVNGALRNQNFEEITLVGFFIHDLHKALERLYSQREAKYRKKFPVYRGQGLTADAFKKMEKTSGGLISFNNFLSTSTEPSVGEGFLKQALKDGCAVGILFIITVDPSITSMPYASVANFSKLDEKEVLFSILTVFRIDRIERHATQTNSWNAHLSSASHQDEDFHKLIERMREEIEGSTPMYRLGALMIKLGRYDKADEVYQNVIATTRDPLEKGHVYYQLGQVKYNQELFAEAHQFYDQALTIYRQKLPPDHPNIATIYNNVGLVLDSQGNYSEALKSYQQARQIYEQKLDKNHPILGACYTNIATAYDNLQQYERALDFYNRADKIYQRTLSENDPTFATYYSNVGLCHLNMKNYPAALDAFENAARIGKLTLPWNHPNLEVYRQNLEAAQKKMKK